MPSIVPSLTFLFFLHFINVNETIDQFTYAYIPGENFVHNSAEITGSSLSHTVSCQDCTMSLITPVRPIIECLPEYSTCAVSSADCTLNLHGRHARMTQL